MSHKPKPVRDHYTESLAVNAQNLAKQLEDASVPGAEAKKIVDVISAAYLKQVDGIVEECERDMMALENVPSPLGLFVSCISKVIKDIDSPKAADLLQKYVAAWEDWM
jgi:hypothetical protein